MKRLIFAETRKGGRPVPGADSLIFCRSFHAERSHQEHRFTFLPTSEALDPHATSSTLTSGISFERIAPLSRGAYALVVNLGGEFQTVDELFLDFVSIEIKETVVTLALTRVECTEGEPALVDVFLIMPLNPEVARSNRLRFTFAVRRRSYDGEVTVLDDAMPDCVVSLTRP